ncbi:hypothetical protein [Kutzneria sp. CA-103260]|uniref:hypothetical protein n=1 Tax=Kutzneria sp. CA-103260 TaxID=2802641 RepID=UPI001BA976E4|nr:hypothetical protein [Kutzneria sp. CA-103260]QUQ62926.1 hypothetical protein JJ691_06380 [Kutzneria sp. CA-103260]
MDHEKVLDNAWHTPGVTAIELPAVDVNQVLADHYELDRELTFTRTMLWDMEARKAAAPDVYIPTVVAPGSATKFPSTRHEELEDFTRVSDQRLWGDRDRFGTIIEHVRLDHGHQRAFFVGDSEFRDVEATTDQPLFHVEHSVAGAENRPLNLWRIMVLTEAVDQHLVDVFTKMGEDPYLRVFIEVYLEKDLGVSFRRK